MRFQTHVRRQRLGQLGVVGPGLLQADHVGGGPLQPVQQAQVVVRALPDRGPDTVDVDSGEDHGWQPIVEV